MGIVLFGEDLMDEEGRRFTGPRDVAQETKEKLGIFQEQTEVEKLARSPAVMSVDGSNSYSNYEFQVSNGFEDLTNEKNYEKLPVMILHNIFVYLRPQDLISLFTSCRYIHRVGLNNIFWRKYYIEFFGLERQDYENLPDLNFKKQFFKRYSDCRCANLYYLKNQRPIFISSERGSMIEQKDVKIFSRQFGGRQEVLIGNKNCQSTTDFDDSSEEVHQSRIYLDYGMGYTLCGPPGIGKKSLLLRNWQDKFDEDEENGYPLNKSAGNGSIRFNVIKREFRHQQIGEKTEIDNMYYEESFKKILILETPLKKKKNDPVRNEVEIMTDSWLFCFTAGDRKTFEQVKKYVREFSSKMKKSVPKKQRKRGILVGLKSDLLLKDGSKREVSVKEIQKYVHSTSLKGYIECSSKEDTSCYLPFGVLVQKMVWRTSGAGG